MSTKTFPYRNVFSTTTKFQPPVNSVLVKIGDLLRMPFTPALRFNGRLSEMQAFGDAFGHAGRLQPLVDTVYAKIAFNRFAGLRVPLGGAPGAGGNAGLTPHTQVGFDKDDAILRSLLHRAGRAGRHTPGVLAVKTRHEHPGHTG